MTRCLSSTDWSPAIASETSLVERLRQHADSPALVGADGTLTYPRLLEQAARCATRLLDDRRTLAGERVVFMVDPGPDYVVTLLGIWLAGAMAVPLRPGMPGPEVAYVLDDAEPVCVVIDERARAAVAPVAAERGVPLVSSAQLPAHAQPLPQVVIDAPALMLYTSGTTGRPKGVVLTHSAIAAQVTSLVEAWGWSATDRILLVLPLHHVHGIVNVVCCSLWSAAVCEMADRFDAERVWERFAAGGLTLFMAVPTIYYKLIGAWESADEPTRTRWSDGARRLRLMVSGSAALPISTLERWREITGQLLLERYGMTEIGMGLSNTLDSRVAGSVGYPLPGVEARIVDEEGNHIHGDGAAGELLVRGDGVFSGYWRRPEATAEAFDGSWFRTGDVVSRDQGRYRILGRASVDIIKSGGEKVSALEIEDLLRTHDAIADCAVVGLPDAEWGERVSAAVVARPGAAVDVEALRVWGKQHLSPYKVPRSFLVVDELPRNAMGKVVKADIKALFSDNPA